MFQTFRTSILRVLSAAGVLIAVSGALPAQPRLILDDEGPTAYRVGERIDSSTYVLNRRLEKVRLLQEFQPEARVVVLIINGGGLLEIPAAPFRGFLWCQDSFDDMAVQRSLVRLFEGESVQFVPIFVPPVYNPSRYGYPENAFLDHPEDSKIFREAAQTFVDATLEHQESGFFPFDGEPYFDPKFRLAYNFRERLPGENYGPVPPWQGRLKWSNDLRRYGTPTLWFLGSDGTILRPPLLGNDYDASPPVVNYGFFEARQAIEELLKK